MHDPRAADRLLAALTCAVDTVAVIDVDGTLIAVSPSFEPMLGYPPGAVVGRNGLDLIHPDDAVLARDTLVAHVAAGGRTEPVDLRVRHAAGGWLAVRVIGVNRLADPQVRGIVLTIRDKTGMAEYETALAERDDRYRQIVELAAEGVWITDDDLRTSFVTGRMAAMLGYRQDEMIGRTATEFMDDAGRAEAARLLERRRSGISEQIMFRFVHRDGHPIHTSVATTPIMGPHGDFEGAIGMLTDVTDLLAERTRLAAEEARHRALLDALARRRLPPGRGRHLSGFPCPTVGGPGRSARGVPGKSGPRGAAEHRRCGGARHRPGHRAPVRS